MNHELLLKIEHVLQGIICRYYNDRSINIFDEFVKFCHEHYDGPAHTLAEIKLKHNTKLKGDIFEHFALKYLQVCYKPKTPSHQVFSNVWLLKDVPEPILNQLKLKRGDFGIDLIAETRSTSNPSDLPKYYAIQAKYRKKGYKATHGISWRQMSTFYGLINRTGPYERHIAITNANYVRHMGIKNQKDHSICYGTLSKISLDDWRKMANFTENTLGTEFKESVASTIEFKENIEEPIKKQIPIKRKPVTPLMSVEDLRKKRMEYLSKKD